jgi:hypothetical protein
MNVSCMHDLDLKPTFFVHWDTIVIPGVGPLEIGSLDPLELLLSPHRVKERCTHCVLSA